MRDIWPIEPRQDSRLRILSEHYGIDPSDPFEMVRNQEFLLDYEEEEDDSWLDAA